MEVRERTRARAIPPIRRGEEVQSPTLPLPPPRDRETTHAFLSWIANTPKERVADVREAIASLTEKSAVAEVLNEELFSFPCRDTGRRLILLSTIGELRDSSSIAALNRFMWLSDEHIFGRTSERLGTDDFSNPGMLQARSAEMLVWVAQGKHDDLVLKAIREHPSGLVRVSAIDAFLFASGDAPEAIEFLRGQVNPADLPMIGLPRFGNNTDPKTFERLTAAYEAAHPSVPRLPERRRRNARPHPRALLGICAAGVIGLGLLLAINAKRRTARRYN